MFRKKHWKGAYSQVSLNVCLQTEIIMFLEEEGIIEGGKKGGVPGGYSYTLPIRVCAAQRGRDFDAPDLERGIHFRGVF